MNEGVLDILDRFQARECDRWMLEDPFFRARIVAQIMSGPVAVLPSMEKPAAIVGITAVYGVASCWMVTGIGFERAAPVIVRQVRGLCDSVVAAFDLRRLHMMVDSDNPRAQRFAARLGFVCEAAGLKKLGARGQDVDIYLYSMEEKDGRSY